LTQLRFQCPTSFDDPKDDDRDGHSIIVPLSKEGTYEGVDSIWTREGDSLEDITLSPSVNCTESKSCKFHGHVKNGKVTW